MSDDNAHARSVAEQLRLAEENDNLPEEIAEKNDLEDDGDVDQDDGGIHQIDCPECDWQSREFDDIRGELATKVDAEMHYVKDHGGRIPDDAPFGEHQCPECFDTHGLHRTVSCSECGFIPDGVRA